MNKKVAERIQALKSELEMLEKELAEPKKEGRWIPKLGERFFYINTDGDAKSINEKHDYRIATFNYFKTVDEADRMAEKINLLLAMTARVKELNGDWVANWEATKQQKFGLRLLLNRCDIDWFCESNSFIFGLSVQSKEHAEILLEEFKERIERWY